MAAAPVPRPACGRPAGFTLVEVATVCAVVGVLAAVAVPGWQQHLAQGRRADAVAALTLVQQAQEQHRSAHGLYAHELSALHGVPTGATPQGFYTLALQSTGAEAYRATARPSVGSPQLRDSACPELTLDVNQGFARLGPQRRCWNR